MTSTTDHADARAAGTSGGPLAGITVLDLSAYIAGPYGCTLLADLGAQVVKIEPPGGDNLRTYPSTLADESRAFLGVNRGKQGLALDLKQPEALEILHRLLATADVLGASRPRQLPGFRTPVCFEIEALQARGVVPRSPSSERRSLTRQRSPGSC